MAAHIRGQESVIYGLRSERKLWGQELAQQGWCHAKLFPLLAVFLLL